MIDEPDRPDLTFLAALPGGHRVSARYENSAQLALVAP